MKKVLILGLLLAVPFLLSAQESESRTALVIGNGDYEISPLQNPANDAGDMATILKDLGFEVNTIINGTHREMFTAIQDFGWKLNQYNVGLFYYAGHGIQFEGTNFIVPIDANIQKDVDIQFETININRVLAEMESAGNAVNIVILDACRNNPYVSRFRSINRGLTVVVAPAGSLIVYATAPGDVAEDGLGRNGIFTAALLKHIKTPDIEVREMLTMVRRDVMAATSNEQTPWDSSSLTGSFYFGGADGAVAAFSYVERTKSVAEKPVLEPKGLVAYYPFNGNVNDKSGNGNHGTEHGATLTIDRFGNANSAYSFDGVDDYIEIAGSSAMEFPSMTLCAWAKDESASLDHMQKMIVAKHVSTVHRGFCLYTYSEDYYFYVGHEGPPDDSKDVVAPLGDSLWHLVVGIYDNGTMKLYIDGVLKDSDSISGMTHSPENVRFGSLAPGGPWRHYWEGLIDDVRVYSRALSESQILALYHEGGWN